MAMDRQLVPMLEQPAQPTRADWLRMRLGSCGVLSFKS